MEKIKIISIVGSGRSGSTILSILLSQNKDVFNLGQSRDLWRALAQNAKCSCSHELRRCVFWAQVAQASISGQKHFDLLYLNNLNQDFIRDAKHLTDWTNKNEINALKIKHNDYLSLLKKSCSAYRAFSGRDSFVDSSKSPEIALAFSLLDNVELYVLNLVRDPRAVACSWHNKRQNREFTIMSIKEWKRREVVLKNWSEILGRHYLRMRYEDFVESPRSNVADILNWAGVDAKTDYFISDADAIVTWVDQHLFPPANEKTLAKKAIEITIRAPQEWKKQEYRSIHEDAIRYTAPLGLHYIQDLQNNS